MFNRLFKYQLPINNFFYNRIIAFASLISYSFKIKIFACKIINYLIFFTNLGIKTAPFIQINSFDDLKNAKNELTFPFFLKKRRNGYDGKGQVILKNDADLFVWRADSFAIEHHRALACRIESGNRAQQRRFSAARAADQGDDFAELDTE